MAAKAKGTQAHGPAGVPKMISKLPSDTVNSLPVVAQDLVDNPKEKRVAVVEFDVGQVVQDTDTQTVIPHVRIRRFEVIPEGGEIGALNTLTDHDAVKRALVRAAEARLGKTPLDGFDDLEELDDQTDFLRNGTGVHASTDY